MPETPWGRRIREEMNRRGWDNAQLARMSGLSESTVSRVSGDCMEPEIMSGDIVIVDLAAREPRPGQIVAALLRDGTMAVKRYERHRGYPRLVDNKGRVYPVDGAQIQGLVVSFIRRFR